jgi:L,D-transpeptidase YbiS
MAVVTVAAVVVLVAVVTAVLAVLGGGVRRRSWTEVAGPPPSVVAVDQAARRRLGRSRPRGVFVAIDTARGQLRVVRDGVVLREAVCSAGSGTVLREPGGGRQWVFDTPLGERRVLSKQRDPVWTKPDWAFIEEGMAPPIQSRFRYDDVSLGDYSLSLGDGYLIHGTLFQTLLGQSVTHGCVRLGDQDLEYVWKTIPVGARVFLF